MNIERYMKKTNDTTKQQIDTFIRWLKELRFAKNELKQRIKILELQISGINNDIKDINKFKKLYKE